MTAEQAIHWLNFLPLDEPVFVLRARDPLAVRTIVFWIEQAESAGVPVAKRNGALALVGSFERWPIRKLPG